MALQLTGMFVGRSTVATSVALLQALIVEHDSTMPLFVLVASLMEQRYVWPARAQACSLAPNVRTVLRPARMQACASGRQGPCRDGRCAPATRGFRHCCVAHSMRCTACSPSACLGKLPTPASPAPSPSELLLRARHLRSRTPESALAVYFQANVLVTVPLAPLNRRSSAKPSSPTVAATAAPSTAPALALPASELTEAGLVLPVEELFTAAPAVR